ncbi:MAG: DUF3299 domain-containing protein [Acidobacteriota bacterium]
MMKKLLLGALALLAIASVIVVPRMPSMLGANANAADLSIDATAIDWYMLAGLDPWSGEISTELAALDGQLVQLPGYVVPLEDDATKIPEFLLVPYVGACVHLPPPPPNQMVYVKMAPGTSVEVEWWGWDPVWIVGRLAITSYESPWGAVGFTMEGLGSGVFTWEEDAS